MDFNFQTRLKGNSRPNLQSFDTYGPSMEAIVAWHGLWMVAALLRHFEQALRVDRPPPALGFAPLASCLPLFNIAMHLIRCTVDLIMKRSMPSLHSPMQHLSACCPESP